MKKLFILAIFSIAMIATAGNGKAVNAKLGTVSYNPGMAKRGVTLAVAYDKAPTTDFSGVTHQRYNQTYKGLPVFGGDIVEHNKDGNITYSGRVALIDSLDPRPSVARKQARDAAVEMVGQTSFASRLVVLPLAGGNHLAWQFSENGEHSRWEVFVDAHSGLVLNAFNDMHSGTGTGVLGDTKDVDTTFAGSTYQMISASGHLETYDAKNRSRTPGSILTDSDDVWTDAAAVDAHHYAGLVMDLLLNRFGRNSYDGNGSPLKSSVHYQRDLVNAYWNGTQMLYGDGDGVNSLALSGGFDVVAHEITHGVTDFSSDLIYQNESGALNEGFSDIMGAIAEYYKQPGQFDWLLGEDIWTPGIAGDALRYMDNPTLDGSSRDHYDDRYTGTADYGGVHWNSGIANLAFVIAVQGGSHPTYGGSYTGVGMDDASQIFFTAFTEYLTSSATFSDARAACVAAATDGGYSQTVIDNIDAAWVAVGVPEGGTSGPSEIQLSQGEAFSSDHNYGNNENITWNYTNTGASSVTVTFSIIDMERNYDYIYVKDGAGNVVATFTAKYRNGVTVTVQGDTLKVNMVTDGGVTKYGFDAVVN